MIQTPIQPVQTSAPAPVLSNSQVRKMTEKVRQNVAKCIIDGNGNLKPFAQIPISTRTVIVLTNCTVDLAALFQYAPVIDFEPQVKRRGRKKRNNFEKPVPKIPFGSVVKVQHELKIRGTDLKKKDTNTESTKSASSKSAAKPFQPQGQAANEEEQMNTSDDEESVDMQIDSCETNSTGTTGTGRDTVVTNELIAPNREGNYQVQLEPVKKAYFLHCVTLVIAIHSDQDKENITKNVKLFSNGKMQITGCKNDDQYINTVKAVFQLFHTIEQYIGQPIVVCNDPNYRAVFNTVMQNMDFYMGFGIYRNKLDQFMNTKTDYITIFEPSMNPCVNIEIPIQDSDAKMMSMEYNRQTQAVTRGQVNHKDFQHYFAKKNPKKKPAVHTFLVFASGRVIFSSSGSSSEKIFYEFINLMIQNRLEFEETQLVLYNNPNNPFTAHMNQQKSVKA
jgi:TATA-box binding protein (TBP) (component of TFIID and TFIIIB)